MMKRIIQFLMAIALFCAVPNYAFAESGMCQNCGESDFEDSDFLCDDCLFCEDCRVHCPSCDVCLTVADYCDVCYVCEDCWDGDHCAECNKCTEDICPTCNFCNDCVRGNGSYHCRLCGECRYDDDDIYECCEFCASCAYDNNVHCMECGDCVETGASICPDCYCCYSCAEELGRHCQVCTNCFDEGECCTDCYACSDCQMETHCHDCGQCCGPGAEIRCSTCDCCVVCAQENFFHCLNCEVCNASIICHDCGYCSQCAIEENRHCESCHQCSDDICPICVLCKDCSIDFETHCSSCNVNHLDEGGCEVCGKCDDCIEDLQLHCVNCGACGDETDLCDNCKMCFDCAEFEYAHCIECGGCYASDGGVCPDCNYCDECALSNGEHCNECLQHAEVCENCGYCFPCADSEGYHCPLCGECKADDMCESGGEHCSDCCADNGWICDKCGVCVEASRTQKCDHCDLCMECCVSESKEASCKHGICVESPDWSDHYCDQHKMCKADCASKHADEDDFKVKEHEHDFDENGVCSVCKQNRDGSPNIIRQPRNAKCVVPNQNDELAAYDTICFSVGVASSADLTYKWFTCTEDGKNVKAIDKNSDGDDYVNGAGTANLTVTIPFDACHVNHYYYCEVSNAKGEKSVSEKALVEASHGVAWLSMDKLAKKVTEDVKKTVIHDDVNGTDKTYEYSDYHYRACPSAGCNYSGASVTKARHNYGGWEVVVAPTETRRGVRTRQCADCGEKYWQQIDKMPVDGMPFVIRQPKGGTVKTSDSYLPEVGDYDYPSFPVSVEASGEGPLQYTWYRIVQKEETDKPSIYVASSVDDTENSSHMNCLIPPLCNYAYFGVFCKISNSKGVVYSDTVQIKIDHSYATWCTQKQGYYMNDPGVEKKIVVNKPYPNSTKPVEFSYSDYHYIACIGCTEWTKKIKHTYGDWKISVKPTATSEGSMYKECNGCGERFWMNLPKGESSIAIAKCTGNVSARSTAYNDETGEIDTKNIVKFSVQAVSMSGNNLTYQWQEKNGDVWTNLSNVDKKSQGQFIDGVSTPDLAYMIPVGACTKNNKRNIRCVITDTKTKETYATNPSILTINHNMKWMSTESIAYKLYTRTNSTWTYFESNYTVTATPQSHHYVCCDKECHSYSSNNINLHHETHGCSYSYTSIPTTTTPGKYKMLCSRCQAPVEKSRVAKLPAEYKDAYIVNADVASVVGIGTYGKDKYLTLRVESGCFNRDEVLSYYLLKPDGSRKLFTSTSYMYSDYDEVRNYAQYVMEPQYPGDEYLFDFGYNGIDESTVPIGSIITNDPDVVKLTNKVTGVLTTVSKYELFNGNTDYEFNVNGKWIQVKLQNVPSVDALSNKEYQCKGIEVILKENGLLIPGMKIPVRIKSAKVVVGTFVVGKTEINDQEIYLITRSGEIVYLESNYSKDYQNVLPDGSVVWNGSVIELRDAKLQALVIGEGKKIKIISKGKSSIINNGGKLPTSNALQALCPVVVEGYKESELTISSSNGIAVLAKNLTINQNDVISYLNCTGDRYAIVADTLDYSGTIELKAKCTDDKGMPLNVSHIVNEDFKSTYLSKINQRIYKTESNGYFIAEDDKGTKSMEFQTYVKPNVMSSNQMILFDGLCGDVATEKSNGIESGTMKYDAKTRTLTMDNVVISNKGFVGESSKEDVSLYIVNSAIDTLYIKLIGENVIEDVMPNASKNVNSCALAIADNVKFIGNGTLRVKSKKNSGVKFYDLSSLTLADNVKLFVDCDTKNYGLSTDNNTKNRSKLRIGENTTLDMHSNGIYGLQVVDIIGNGDAFGDSEKAIFDKNEVHMPKRIVYPGCYAYVYNVDSDYQMHMSVDGDDYDQYRFVVSSHPNIRLGAWWVPAYDLESDGFVNYQDGGSGSGSYDADSNTLYLNDYVSTGDSRAAALFVGESGVNVVLSGDCKFVGDGAPAINISSDVLFSSKDSEEPGNLYVNSKNEAKYGIQCNGKSIGFSNLNAMFGDNAGIYSPSASLIQVENCSMEFGDKASITGAKLKLKNSAFKEDGMMYDNVKRLAVVKGSTVVDGNFAIILHDDTGVDEIIATEGDEIDFNQPVYDLVGRRMMISNTYKGVVIQNGQKYLLNVK